MRWRGNRHHGAEPSGQAEQPASVGYTVPYAIGSILLTAWGSVIVVLMVAAWVAARSWNRHDCRFQAGRGSGDPCGDEVSARGLPEHPCRPRHVTDYQYDRRSNCTHQAPSPAPHCRTRVLLSQRSRRPTLINWPQDSGCYVARLHVSQNARTCVEVDLSSKWRYGPFDFSRTVRRTVPVLLR